MRRNCTWFALLLGLLVVDTRLRQARAEEPNPSARWEKAIAAFEESDRENPPPKHAVLFVGSSSIRRWDLPKYFGDKPVINRGFGGSQIADAVQFADRIILPYEPSFVIVYAGDNDIAADKPPLTVFNDFRKLVNTIHTKLPQTHIAFIAIKPSIRRWNLVGEIKRTNALIERASRNDARLEYLDVFKPMLGPDGAPKKELFVEDGLHLSDGGYTQWTRVVDDYLQRKMSPVELDTECAQIVAKAIADGPNASYAVAVVKDGRVLLVKGYGLANIELQVPANEKTVYRLGSITKQFTAVAILQLVDRGKISLDDPITRFLEDYPTQGHEVTIHHLLNHTSGIKSYTGLPGFRERMREDLSHRDLRAMFQDEPFDFEPGTAWKYNNSGFFLLGMIIEKVSGESYSAYLEKHIFKPLGMTATRYGEHRAIIANRASGYSRRDGKLVNADYLSMNMPGAAGALVSNVIDLVKWHQALEAGRLLSPKRYDEMYRAAKLANGKTHPYGYGWAVAGQFGRRCFAHGGGINGFNTYIGRYPDDKLAIIVLSNTEGSNPARIERTLAARLLLTPKLPTHTASAHR